MDEYSYTVDKSKLASLFFNKNFYVIAGVNLKRKQALLESNLSAIGLTDWNGHFIPKNRIIEEEGKILQYLYFVVSGFIRLFYNNHDVDEITTHINCPPSHDQYTVSQPKCLSGNAVEF